MAAAVPLAAGLFAKIGTLVGGAAAAGGAAAGGTAAAGGGIASALTAGSTALTAGLAAKQLLTRNKLPDTPKVTPLPDDAALAAARRRKLAAEIAATGPTSTMLTGDSRRTLGG